MNLLLRSELVSYLALRSFLFAQLFKGSSFGLLLCSELISDLLPRLLVNLHQFASLCLDLLLRLQLFARLGQCSLL